METSKHLVPVVMMTVTALASSALSVQASQPHLSASHLQQEAVPVLLATAVPATSIEPEHLIQYRFTKGIESGLKGRDSDKWPRSL